MEVTDEVAGSNVVGKMDGHNVNRSSSIVLEGTRISPIYSVTSLLPVQTIVSMLT